MSIRKLFSTIFELVVLATPMALANAQMSEQAAREQASNIARSELHSTVHFKADQFLGIQRDEELEQTLGVAVGGQAGLTFIYKASPEGVELRENAIVYHTWTDVDPVFIVVIEPRDGSAYRIHGFGRGESLTEFERLMTALKVQVTSPDQAESVADFYRKVNPENHEGLTPILRLMELKQAAERQCQSGAKSFDAGEKAFSAWWKRAKPLYAALPFQQKAVPHGSGGYVVEWIVLSSPSRENCGGAPLRAKLEVSSDGHVGKVTFSPLQKRLSHAEVK
ncbi:MAG TPA: hypothetical protein VLB32_02725 [Candidatus Acidoferrales bacterium]|nr:hypothetical protein [Candidatus Acidoferrales bacterium]